MNLAYALGTLGLIVMIQRLFRGFMATVAVLVGLVTGTLVAWALGDAHLDDVGRLRMGGRPTPFYFAQLAHAGARGSADRDREDRRSP